MHTNIKLNYFYEKHIYQILEKKLHYLSTVKSDNV